LIQKKSWFRFSAFIIASSVLLNGCAVVAVGAVAGAAGTTAAVATDPRSSSTVVNDNTIEVKLRNKYADDLPKANIYVNCYNGSVLLTGQIDTDKDKNQAEFTAKAIPGVRQVYNYMEVKPTQSFGSRSTDSFTTTQIKTKILGLSGVSSNDIKVVTTDNVVYLAGIVNKRQAKQVASAAASINGVRKVVTLFEYIP
jgi:osmotically-inducible protein OsmY